MSLHLEGITKNLAHGFVISDLNLQVEKGELFVLLGASGCGKSTLLRVIAGLLLPEAGKVILNDIDVTNMPAQERHVGLVFQHYALFEHMSVEQNIEFGLRVRGIEKEARRQRTAELLELVELLGLEKRFAKELSGGQRQRVALARALAFSPRILLLDEPFSALDARIREQLRQSVKEIQRQLKLTTILVTHDQEEAFEIADRIGVMEKGRLVESGASRELYFRPRTRFAATFLGSGAVFVGSRTNEGVVVGESLIQLEGVSQVHNLNRRVRILIRPEAVHLMKPGILDKKLYKLGKATLEKRIFSGTIEKFTFSLSGVSPIAHFQSFGRHAANIEMISPSGDIYGELKVGNEYDLGFSSYHIIESSGLRAIVLLANDKSASYAHILAEQIIQVAEGQVTFMPVVGEAEFDQNKWLNDWQILQGKHKDYQDRIKVKSLPAFSTKRIFEEAGASLYDFLVIDSPSAEAKITIPRLLNLSIWVLNNLRLPVILMSKPSKTINKVLVLTAAGEPGKEDIYFAARLCRNFGAEATVLHVLPANQRKTKVEQVDRHLKQAQASFASVGVSSNVKLAKGNLQDEIDKEIKSNQYDLVVLGAPKEVDADLLRSSPIFNSLLSSPRQNIALVPSTSLERSYSE